MRLAARRRPPQLTALQHLHEVLFVEQDADGADACEQRAVRVCEAEWCAADHAAHVDDARVGVIARSLILSVAGAIAAALAAASVVVGDGQACDVLAREQRAGVALVADVVIEEDLEEGLLRVRESTLLVRVRAAYCKKYVTSKKQYWGRGSGSAAILVYTDVSCQCCHCRRLAHGARGAGCRRRRGPQPGRRPQSGSS